MDDTPQERRLVAWLRKFDRPLSDKVSGARKRRALRYPGPYSWDRKTNIWRLNIWQPHARVMRGKPR
jgi:hypothetical protein